MKTCPKCHQRYTPDGPHKKTKHHIIPRRLWKDRVQHAAVLAVLESYIFNICRGCHDELNHAIEMAEREILYVEHQQIYAVVLTDFLKEARHEDSPMVPRTPRLVVAHTNGHPAGVAATG